MINCGFPGYLHNGAVTGNSYLFRDVVSFSCDTGYRLQHLFIMRYRIQVTTFIHHAIQDTGYNIYSSCDTGYRLQHFLMMMMMMIIHNPNVDDDHLNR